MNLDPTALRAAFLRYHQDNKRQIRNRDKALVPYENKDRFYFTPSAGTWVRTQANKPIKHYVPAPDCNWEFVLYRTAILTVYAKDNGRYGVISTGGWGSNITFEHICALLPLGVHFGRWKPNKWTRSQQHVYWGVEGQDQREHCEYKDGMRWDLHNNCPVNPPPNKSYVVDFKRPEVREIRRNITLVKQRYMPLARLHATSEVNPFEGVTCDSTLSYEGLIAETEPCVETYAALVASHIAYWRMGWNSYSPDKVLDRVLDKIRDDMYFNYNYLVERD